MQRLYLQFYVTILVVLAVFVGAAVLLWRVADDDNRTPQYLDVAAELTGALLPEASAPRPDQQRAIEALQRKLRFDIALYEADGDGDGDQRQGGGNPEGGIGPFAHLARHQPAAVGKL